VGLELDVLAEGRYHPQNFPDATVDFSQLAWDPHNSISNYSMLVQSALAANGSRGWLTESAAPADLGTLSLGSVNPGLAFAYTTNCLPIAPTCNASVDAGSSVMAMCTLEAVCDDLSLAMDGITGPLWVTRLRADLPASALATDLDLEATTQTQVTNLHTTEKYTDPNYNPCPGSNGASSSPSSGSGSSCAVRKKTSRRARYADAIELSFGMALMALALRRRRRR
jgi:hypothetical protein